MIPEPLLQELERAIDTADEESIFRISEAAYRWGLRPIEDEDDAPDPARH